MDEEKKIYLYAKPDIKWLAQTFEETHSDLSQYRQLMAKNANTRFCKWAGQSEDGRKNGDSAYPWEGASDIRFPLIDDHINTNVATLVESERRAQINATPTKGSDMKRAKLVTNFMKWLTRAKMDELTDEVELAANYWEEKGGFIAGIFWDRQILQWQEKIEIKDIARLLADQGVDPESLQDPMFEENFRQILLMNYPDSKDKDITRAIEDLRTTGTAILPKSGQTVNRPCVRVFRKGEDIIYPESTTNIQSSPYIFRVEYKTPQQVKNYELTDKWNKSWVEEVLEGYVGADSEDYYDDLAERNRDRLGLYLDRNDDNAGLIKVVWAYQRLISKEGIPGIYETIFTPGYTPDDKVAFAKHGLCEYRLKGKYPFHDFSREKVSRNSFNSRGLPDNAGDQQRIIKTYIDGEIDRQTMSMDPPFEYVIGRQVPERGPGAMWPVSRRGEAGYGDVPKFDPATRDMREWIIDYSRNYCGLITDEEHSNEVRHKKQANINKWLRGWQQTYRMVFWLYQQYGDEETTFRVMGSATTKPEEFHKEVGEDYDFYLEFDALSQEPELQQKKVQSLIELFSAADRNGRGNWDGLLQMGVDVIDPSLSEMLIKPEDAAVQDEYKEEADILQKMWAGMDVTMPDQGINTQLRMQMVQQYIQGTEEIPATDVQQRLQSDEAFKARLEKHLKQIKFIEQQRENAQIGREGVKPGMRVQ